MAYEAIREAFRLAREQNATLREVLARKPEPTFQQMRAVWSAPTTHPNPPPAPSGDPGGSGGGVEG